MKRADLTLASLCRGTLLTLFVAGLMSHSRVQPSHGQGPALPDGEGKAELQRLCSPCHEVEKSYSLKQDRAGWQRTMAKMAAAGMKSTEREYTLVLEYLIKHFAADEVQKINVNKATAIELESGLSLKRSQAAAIIAYRNKNGAFKSIKDLKKVPKVDVAKIEAKKDRLTFEK